MRYFAQCATACSTFAKLTYPRRQSDRQIRGPHLQSLLEERVYWARVPTTAAHDPIVAPTLILSCEDDLFGKAATARLLAERIPGAELTVFLTGGHIWLGHDDDMADRIAAFVAADGQQ